MFHYNAKSASIAPTHALYPICLELVSLVNIGSVISPDDVKKRAYRIAGMLELAGFTFLTVEDVLAVDRDVEAFVAAGCAGPLPPSFQAACLYIACVGIRRVCFWASREG